MLYCSLSLWFVGTQNLFLCHVTQPVDILEFTALTVVKKKKWVWLQKQRFIKAWIFIKEIENQGLNCSLCVWKKLAGWYRIVVIVMFPIREFKRDVFWRGLAFQTEVF